MRQALSKSISMVKLDVSLEGLDTDRYLGVDGIVTEFYKQYWKLIKKDYLAMITKVMGSHHLLLGVKT